MGSEDGKGAKGAKDPKETKDARDPKKPKDAKDLQDDDCSDLVQVTSSSHKIQDLVKSLPDHFDIKSLPKQEGLARIDCSDDGWEVLEQVKEEFKKDWQRSKKITSMVKAIVPHPEKLSPVDLVGFQEGESNLIGMAGPDVCHILIPIVIVGTREATLEDPQTGRQTTITFKEKSELIVSGRVTIWVEPHSKIICAALAIKDKGNSKG